MSETQPEPLATDRVHTLPIDATGEIARFDVSVPGSHKPERSATIELTIDGDATADYSVEFGSLDAVDGEDMIHWFGVPDDFSYASTAYVDDAWVQSREYVRIMVDTAAASGNEARVVLTYGV